MAASARHKTAIKRVDLSRPVRLALDDGVISDDATVFDYGCGYGADVRALTKRGIAATGWDPAHAPGGEKTRASVVNLGYVVNVIEDPAERRNVLREAWEFAEDTLVVAARLAGEKDTGGFSAYADGCLTGTGTFQKFYDQHELRAWIDDTLGTASAVAAPGVFYVFRSGAQREAFAASRYRRRVAIPRLRRSEVLLEEHESLLRPLMEFYADRGRLPAKGELDGAEAIRTALGSVKRAFATIRRVTGAESWQAVQDARSEDLLVHLALQRFGREPKFSEMPPAMQLDVKAFFGSYKRARALAEILLFSAGDNASVNHACRESTVGKVMPEALYVHQSALASLAPILRVYEGCARAYIGAVDGANVVKLSRSKAQVSYLRYPDFEKSAHPTLHGAVVVPLASFRVSWRSYAGSQNPPILHRKELFVADDHPDRQKYARLTKQEERAGLFDLPSEIGSLVGWQGALRTAGYRVRGHRLVRA